MIQNQNFTSIGKSTVLKGLFNFSGNTHLLGNLSGEITVNAPAKLILEIGSKTEAIILCHDIEIYGEFYGDIKANGTVIIYPTANVSGKIIAKGLEILPGATVNMSGHTEEE